MCSVLKGIWSGQQYEVVRHSGDRYEGELWQKMRVPFPVRAHALLIKSFIHVPHTFHHPHELLLGENSALPFQIKESATGSASSSCTQWDSWHGLSVSLTGAAAILTSEL